MLARPLVALLLAIVLIGSGCAREAEQLAGPSPAPTAGQTPDAEPAPGDQPRCETQTGGDPDAAMFLRDVTIETHPGYDRVVFELVAREGEAAAVPFWEISPAEPPLREAGTGNEVAVDGDAHLGIVLWASGVELRPDEVRTVYTGPQRFAPEGATQLVELRQAGDFENVNTWYAGTRTEACFIVTTEPDPLRVVLDIHA